MQSTAHLLAETQAATPKVYDGRPSLEALERRIGAKLIPEVKTAVWNTRRYLLRVYVVPCTHPGLAWERVDGEVKAVEHPRFTVYRTRGDGRICGSSTALDTELTFE